MSCRIITRLSDVCVSDTLMPMDYEHKKLVIGTIKDLLKADDNKMCFTEQYVGKRVSDVFTVETSLYALQFLDVDFRTEPIKPGAIMKDINGLLTILTHLRNMSNETLEEKFDSYVKLLPSNLILKKEGTVNG